jgi:hypothetical protein
MSLRSGLKSPSAHDPWGARLKSLPSRTFKRSAAKRVSTSDGSATRTPYEVGPPGGT